MGSLRIFNGLIQSAFDSGETVDWMRVLKYFIATWVLILLSSIVVGLWLAVSSFFFMPIWFVVWFLVLNALGLFNKY
jgi:hypothetical protein